MAREGVPEPGEKTPPPARLEIPLQTLRSTESLANATCPSQYRALTPPGWKPRAAFQPGLWYVTQSGRSAFGGSW